MRKSGVENCSLCVNLVAAYGVRSFRKCLILVGRVLQVMRKPTKAPGGFRGLFVLDRKLLSNFGQGNTEDALIHSRFLIPAKAGIRKEPKASA